MVVAKPVQPNQDHVLLIEDDKGRKELVLQKTIYTLGRAPECDIRINSPFVSRHHATLFKCWADDGETYYRIIDGDPRGKSSSNGLLINGNKLSSHELKHGDKIVFGPQVYVVYQHYQKDIFPTMPPDDPFDITLIDPAMMANDEE